MKVNKGKMLSRYEKFIQTITEISKDTSNRVSLVDSEKTMFDFDLITGEFVSEMSKNGRNASETIRSNDGLLIKDDKYYFIEFKNKKMIRSDNNEPINKDVYILTEKNYNSMLVLSYLTQQNIKELKLKTEYILVYSKDKNADYYISDSSSRDKIGDLLANKSNKRIIKFKQDFFEGYLFNKVLTIDEEEFINNFLPQIG